MKTKKRTSVLIRLTGLVMALAMVLGPVLGMAPAAFAETTANAVLDYSNVNCATVKVTNDEELRNALTSEDNKLIVVQNDITVESQVIESGSRVERVEPFAEIPQIVVNGNKILDLNGHEIYYSDKSQLGYSYTYGGFGNEMVKLQYSSEMDPYNKTLLLVGSGAELTVMDGEGNDGVLQFDSMFSEIDDAPYNIVRNVIEVKDGGKLNVHGGNIIAGRNKQIYSYVDDWVKDFMRTRVVTAYTMGSAVIVDGGDVTITGGVLKGRGRNGYDVEVGGILYKKGSLRIEDGKIFGYGRAPAICLIDEAVKDDETLVQQLKKADIRIKGGYFESYCETYASFRSSLHYSMDKPSYNPFVVYNRHSEFNMGTFYSIFLEDPDDTEIQYSTDCSGFGDTAGDWGKKCYTFTPKNKALNETLLNSEGSTGAVSIYQHQALDVILDYWNEAYWKAQNQFYGTDLMQSYFGVVADAEKNEAYLREHGMTAYFTVSRKVGDQYRAFLSFPVVKGMNEQFPLSIRLKAGSEKWETGEYKVACEITERAGDKSVKNNCNVLTVNVVNSSEMLAFEDVQPKEYASNLGNVSVDTNVKLQFNAKAKAELDPRLSLAKSVMVRKPGSYQYVNAAYDPVTGVYTIPVEQVGYYSVMEIVQLKNGETLLAQKSRELHFAGVDYTKTATVSENLNGTILLADCYGTVKTLFKPNDVVYVQATANQSNLRVKNIVVTNSHGGKVTVQNASFVMPDDDVTVTVAFERFYTLTYKQSADGPAVYTDTFTEGGIALRGAAFTKEGYKQTGWRIGGTVYPVGTNYTENSNSTALPVFEPVKYSTVKYLFWSDYVNGYRFYEHAANYDYSKDPYYTILGEDAFPATPDYLESKHILYFELGKDYESEIEGVTYLAGSRFYPGQSIIPMGEQIELYAVMQEKTLVNPIELTFGAGNKLQVGTNAFLPQSATAGCAVVQVEPGSGGSALTEMVIPANGETKFIVYINANDNYIFPTDPENVIIRFADDAFGALSFTKEPKIEVVTTGVSPSYKNMRVEITFYASCGNDEGDHEFATHWCLNDEQYSYQFCEDCGIMRRVALIAIPDGLTPNQIHRMTLVPEVAGDCANGEYSVGQHYTCADCGKHFSHSYGGDYVEQDLSFFMFLHSWVDTFGNIDFYGNPVPAHYSMCANCHIIDEGTIGFHHDDDHNQMCDECSFAMPCDHYWTYVEVPSTCAIQGTMTKTCAICGDIETIIYNFADHTLVYVEETASTCSEHGKAGHYKCTACGHLFDEDIYVHIKEIDANGVRLASLAAEYPGSEFDHDTFYANDPAYKADYDLQEAVDQYALEHSIAQPVFLPFDANTHRNTELRNAVAVTVNADGYSGDLYCMDCDQLLEAGHTVAKHTHHAAAGEWSFNEAVHYHVCDAYDGCPEHLDEAAHTFGPWTGVALADKIGEQWRECTVCGYVEVLEYVPVPETVNDEKIYTVKDGLDDLASEEGKDVRYIFDLASANDGSVTFEINGISVNFDKNAVKDIAGHDVKFKLTTSTENLGSFGVANAQMALELSLGGVPFAGGKATVSVPVAFEVAEGSEVKVYYVNGGTKEDMNATFANNEVTFKTAHFSTFVIAYESTGTPVVPADPEPAATEDPTPTEPTEKKGGLPAGAIVGIVLGALLVVALVIFLVLFLLKKKGKAPEEAPVAEAQEPAETEAKPEKEGVTFGEKKTLNEEYALLSKDERKLFDKIKAHAITLEGVKATEAQDYYTVSFKKEKIVRFKIKKGEIVAEFFANDKEFKELAGANAKETASSAIKVRTEEEADKVIEAIDYKHKSLTEPETDYGAN